MSLTLQRKDELIQQHHHAYSEWNVDLYGLIASIEAESVKEINDNQEYMKSQQTVISELQTERDALAITVQQLREAIKRQWEADDRLMNAPFNVRKEEYEAALEEHSASHDAFVKLINEKLINEPDTTVNIIKRHDAAVLKEAVERIIDAASIGEETGVEVVRTMIKEKEKS